jgi:transposase
VSETPAPTAAEQAWRAANARLRLVVAAKDEEITVLRAVLAEERAARQRLERRLAELERRLGMDSTNSGTPTSKETIAAVAKRKALRQSSERQRSKDRTRGGQKGRRGTGLEPTGDPDDTREAPPPQECPGCRQDLTRAPVTGWSWGQVWDLPPIELEKVHWRLPRVRCGGCGKTTTATPPFGQAGTVVYGPNVNAAAVLLSSEGNVPVERTAMVMAMLLGAPVSPGFVARAHERLSDRLEQAGFDAAMATALRAEQVLCGDETPVNVLRKDLDPATGQPESGAEHVVTLRTPDARLICYAATGSRSSQALAGLGVLEGYAGYLVRDDYRGWEQFDAQLAGVQQCCQHLLRALKAVHELHPSWQQWADDVRVVLKQAHRAVTAAIVDGHTELDPEALAQLRRRYDKAVRWGEVTNRHREWDEDKNHPRLRAGPATQDQS